MSGPNQVLDEQAVGRRVAERLDAVADGLGPVGLPDWDGVRAGLRRSVRRRRLKRAAIVAGAMTSVVALGGSLQLGVLPYPSWAPAVTVASSAPSALAMQPTKGSLAGDAKWLKAFRDFVASERWDESGGESWSVVNPDDVKVLFAGDVADVRLVAIEAPYRWGLIEARQQAWYIGPAGASPKEMWRGGNGEPSDVIITSWGPGYGVGDQVDTVGVVVLSDGPRPITLKGTPQYATDGSIARSTLALQDEGGAMVFARPASQVGSLSLVVKGRGGQQYLGTTVVDQERAVQELTPGRGVAPAKEALEQAVYVAQDASGLPQDGSTRQLIWAGDESARGSMAVAVKAPSGALIVKMFHFERRGSGVPADLTVLPAADTTTVLPATDLDEVSLAWRQTTTRRDGATIDGDWIGLVGPAAATKAQVLSSNGSVRQEVPLTDGGGAVEAKGAQTVRYLDANGKVLATTNVLATGRYDGPVWDR